jgi:AhpD family alkylhydroperoxidase
VVTTAPSTEATIEDSREPRRVRIDKQHPRIYRAQLEVARAVRTATADAGLSRALVELVNVRISQINRCAYCLHVHVREALLAGETSQRLAVLAAWRETADLFSTQERAALVLAESVTTLPDSRTQEQDYTEAATVLTEEEISAVSWLAIAMNTFNRLSIVSRHQVRPPDRPEPDKRTGKATP